MGLVNSLVFVLIAVAGLAIQAHCDYSPDYPPGPSANLSTVWKSGTNQQPGSFYTVDPLITCPVPGNHSLIFAAGFYCAQPCNSYVFGVYVAGFSNNSGYWFVDRIVLVWSANRDHQVQLNATLSFTSGGDLVLQDVDGSLVWSTNTSGQSVAGMTITELGNLVLFDQNNRSVWQSFDHPTDTLLPRQPLGEGMTLRPNSSFNDWTASKQLYFTALSDGLYAFAGSAQPLSYYVFGASVGKNSYFTLVNGSLVMVDASSPSLTPQLLLDFKLPLASSFQIRFECDGHLRVYEWVANKELQMSLVAHDLLELDYCDYPTVCGEYGICSGGQCSCLTASDPEYFRQIDYRTPNLGCVLETPISCQSMQDHQLIAIPNVSYFYSNYSIEALLADEESCKQSCLTTCSCKAAMFQGGGGGCSFVTEVLSLQIDQFKEGSYNESAYLKIQVTQRHQTAKHRVLLGPLLAGTIVSLVLIIVALEIIRRRRHQEKDGEDEFANIPGMPTRFTFEKLKLATKEFRDKLGEGGFGSVFKGQLNNETVAIKQLDRAGQGKKEFLAEVQIIGCVQHINLVKLIGFCAEKSHRLLVYEYMPRGSLEKWIYYKQNNAPLEWCTRHMIVTGIAKGLSYLHEDCRQRIAHLDIKPQNILLDDSFNAKVSDFGLSKLIDRDESQVVTRMRGTPGYMAPEWLTSQITEKVDVYSFGVVVMEIISGRKNLDFSQPEGSVQLITLLQGKVENGQLEDMIDENSDDMRLHKEEVVEVMKLAMWCLQSDKNRRPAMSLVVKVIEGEKDVQANLDYNFFDLSPAISVPVCRSTSSAPTAASILSAPR
ncbi:hypothetical protein ACQ4PT_049154 [Festuca glaucescens]